MHWPSFFGPPPISKGAMEIAKDVEGITDARPANGFTVGSPCRASPALSRQPTRSIATE